MEKYSWKNQINYTIDVAYWIDSGRKAVTIAHHGDFVCWETGKWMQLFQIGGCEDIINHTGVVHSQLLLLWDDSLLCRVYESNPTSGLQKKLKGIVGRHFSAMVSVTEEEDMGDLLQAL